MVLKWVRGLPGKKANTRDASYTFKKDFWVIKSGDGDLEGISVLSGEWN